MQIFNDKKQRVGILKGFKGRKIVKTLDSGDKELTFKYPSDGKQVDLLKEEYYITSTSVHRRVTGGKRVEKYSYTIPASRRKKRRKKSLTSWIMEFSKKVVVVCVLLYIIIELFSVIAIWHFADTSVLTTLISETSEVLRMGVFGYMIKAGIENWQKIKKGKQESENEEGGANG